MVCINFNDQIRPGIKAVRVALIAFRVLHQVRPSYLLMKKGQDITPISVNEHKAQLDTKRGVRYDG